MNFNQRICLLVVVLSFCCGMLRPQVINRYFPSDSKTTMNRYNKTAEKSGGYRAPENYLTLDQRQELEKTVATLFRESSQINIVAPNGQTIQPLNDVRQHSELAEAFNFAEGVTKTEGHTTLAIFWEIEFLPSKTLIVFSNQVPEIRLPCQEIYIWLNGNYDEVYTGNVSSSFFQSFFSQTVTSVLNKYMEKTPIYPKENSEIVDR